MGNSLIPSREFKIRSTTPDIKVEYFTDDQIEQMKRWIDHRQPGDNRRFRWDDRSKYLFLMDVLLGTGARISEVLQLKGKDIDLENNIIRMRTLKQKREKYRAIPIHPDLRKEFQLRGWIHAKPNERIFNMSRIAVYEFFKKMEKDLGFKIHPHKFRHTFGVKMISAGVPLNDLQKLLGHSSVWTTSIYTEATGRDLQEQINKIKL